MTKLFIRPTDTTKAIQQMDPAEAEAHLAKLTAVLKDTSLDARERGRKILEIERDILKGD